MNALRRSVLLSGSMLSAAALAHALTPRERLVLREGTTRLEDAIPTEFGGWRLDEAQGIVAPSPDVQATLDAIYDEMLARTYRHEEGSRVMLSIAYGRDQGRVLQIHKPESCYAAQGFKVSGLEKVTLSLAGRDVRAMRMVGTRGQRVEPVTYWIRIGTRIVRGWSEQNLVRIGTGLEGYIPDGFLFRVSSVSADLQGAFETQARFAEDLLGAVAAPTRRLLAAI